MIFPHPPFSLSIQWHNSTRILSCQTSTLSRWIKQAYQSSLTSHRHLARSGKIYCKGTHKFWMNGKHPHHPTYPRKRSNGTTRYENYQCMWSSPTPKHTRKYHWPSIDLYTKQKTIPCGKTRIGLLQSSWYPTTWIPSRHQTPTKSKPKTMKRIIPQNLRQMWKRNTLRLSFHHDKNLRVRKYNPTSSPTCHKSW